MSRWDCDGKIDNCCGRCAISSNSHATQHLAVRCWALYVSDSGPSHQNRRSRRRRHHYRQPGRCRWRLIEPNRIPSRIHHGCRAGDRVGGKPQRLAPQRRQRAVWICRGLCLADQVGTERGADGVGAAGRQQTAGLPHRGTGHRDAHGAHGVVPFGLGSEFAAPAWPAAGACCCCSCCCMSCCCCSLCSLTPAFSRMVCARAISASRSS